MNASGSRRRLTILGSTGSIGQNTLDVVSQLGGREAFEIEALTGNGNVELLKAALSGSGIAVGAGPEALIEAASRPSDMVMAAIVGTAGLAPTLAAARRGADIALANKECLVTAGTLFVEAVNQGGGRLLPVDSEHNAIFQVLEEHQRHALERIILTASGGPFRTWSREQMADVTAETAARHPNWSMGRRQRHDVQQGARDDRGEASLRCSSRPD